MPSPSLEADVRRAFALTGRYPAHIREHVGRKVFQRLEECITLAAKEERIEGLSKQRKNQKYTANISRAELADKLQRRYGKRLACQTSTIIRALSELVTCRKRSN